MWVLAIVVFLASPVSETTYVNGFTSSAMCNAAATTFTTNNNGTSGKPHSTATCLQIQ